MTAPDRPPAGGTHRRSSRASRLSVLLASLVGVAVVAVAVVVVLNFRGEPVNHSAPSTAISSSFFDSSARPSAASTGTSSAGPTPSTATPTLASPAPQTTVTGQGGAPSPSLDVLNDSRISGLAHRAADQFSAAGWDVAVIGNFSGGRDVPATTIFFPDGAQAAAQRLAVRFGVDRVLPAPPYLSASHLSVVLARDWDEGR